ncbi:MULTISPECIES: hypothetical protein [Methylobacterium]|nr:MULTISPECIES: hypothetical protein [Methylobacterium]
MSQDGQEARADASAEFGARAPRNETDWIGLIRTLEGIEIP